MKKNKLIFSVLLLLMALLFTQCNSKTNSKEGSVQKLTSDSVKTKSASTAPPTEFSYSFIKTGSDATAKSCRTFVRINNGPLKEFLSPDNTTFSTPIDCNSNPQTFTIYVVSTKNVSKPGPSDTLASRYIYVDQIKDCSKDIINLLGKNYRNLNGGINIYISKPSDLSPYNQIVSWPPTKDYQIDSSFSVVNSDTTFKFIFKE